LETTAFLHPFTPPTAWDFITIVRAEGAHVYDDTGRRYIDAMASLWYCNIGHGRAEVADAVATQLRTLDAFHTFERFTNPPTEELCDRLAGLAPMPGARVFLVGSGSEAVDTALKLARLSHYRAGDVQRSLVVSRAPSYHGVTYGAVSATGLPANQAGFGPLLPDVVQTPHDDLAAVERVAEDQGDRLAAIIAEPVVGAGGVYPPVEGYLEGLRRICDETGAWLILDEVICGFGRLGRWWGAQRFGVEPDLVTFAKGVTSGYLPLGGVLVGRRVRDLLEAEPAAKLAHGHTYSGHPACARAALSALAITAREGLLERAMSVGRRLSAGLRDLADRGVVEGVRGDGAVWAVALGDDLRAPEVREETMRRGMIPRAIGDATISFCPPLVIDDADIDACVDILEQAITSLRAA
jgi:adenosylmethionine-8-amino-7-oxononanoate aminotransferase